MRLVKLALVIGAAALLASPVLAQGRGGRGFGGVSGAMLIRVEKVQKDLGLDKDAVKKAEEALAKVNEDMRDERAKIRDASPEERTKIFAKINEANEKALKDVLSEKQQKRLKQIVRQQEGVAMFQQEDVKKALKLTDDQEKKITEINDDLRKEMGELFQPGQKPAEGAFEKMATMRKDAMSNAVKVLKDDQKKELKELTGERLELTIQDLMQGRGGRGGKPGGDKPRTDF